MNPMVNTAIKRLGETSKEVLSHLEVINKYTYDELAKCMEDIEAKKQDIAALDAQYAEKKRAFDVNFQLDVKADEKKVLEKLATGHNYELVNKDEYKDILKKAEKSEALVKSETEKVARSVTEKLNTEHKLSNNDSVIRISQLESQLEQSRTQNAFLLKEVERLSQEVKEAGERTVRVAEASKAAAVTVTK